METEKLAKGGDGNPRSAHFKAECRFLAHALDFDLNFAATIAAHVSRNFIAGPLARILTINGDDAVSVAEAGARSRRVCPFRLDVHTIGVAQDLHSDAIEARSLILFQLLEFCGR